MDWNIASVVVGIVGVVFAIIQQIRMGRQKRKDYIRYWNITKTAHDVMARIEGIKLVMDKDLENWPSSVSLNYGRALESAAAMVRITLQNIFLQNAKINDEQINYWKSTGLLNGYLLKEFNQMRLHPPKTWENDLEILKGQTDKDSAHE